MVNLADLKCYLNSICIIKCLDIKFYNNATVICFFPIGQITISLLMTPLSRHVRLYPVYLWLCICICSVFTKQCHLKVHHHISSNQSATVMGGTISYCKDSLLIGHCDFVVLCIWYICKKKHLYYEGIIGAALEELWEAINRHCLDEIQDLCVWHTILLNLKMVPLVLYMFHS